MRSATTWTHLDNTWMHPDTTWMHPDSTKTQVAATWAHLAANRMRSTVSWASPRGTYNYPVSLGKYDSTKKNVRTEAHATTGRVRAMEPPQRNRTKEEKRTP
jgi:hypothetical protein